MNPQDLKTLNAALRQLADMYPRMEIKPETIRAYVNALADLPLAAVLAGIKAEAQTNKFFPTVAEIREAIGEHANDPETLAETAWIDVQAEVRRCGNPKRRPRIFHNGEWYDPPTPTFDSPLLAKAVESLGWDLICDHDQDKVREQFLWTYRNLHKQAVKQVQTGDVTAADPLPVRVVPELTQKAGD